MSEAEVLVDEWLKSEQRQAISYERWLEYVALDARSERNRLQFENACLRRDIAHERAAKYAAETRAIQNAD